MTSRTIIVGDIHGMLPELIALLEQVRLTREDHLVSVGDLVDKGPESAGVVKHLRNLRENGFAVTLVQGNHEEKHERFRTAFSKVGDKVRMTGVDELKEITAALSPEDILFLQSAVPFLRLPAALPGGDALVVHAGILPNKVHLPSEEELGELSKSKRRRLDRFCRVRYVRGTAKAKITVEFDLEGLDAEEIEGIDGTHVSDLAKANKVTRVVVKPKHGFLALGEEGPGDPYWADVYDGCFGHVFFGHNPYPDAEEPLQFAHATGLDLGAVFGGRLAAAVLSGGQPEFSSVRSRGRFAATLWDD